MVNDLAVTSKEKKKLAEIAENVKDGLPLSQITAPGTRSLWSCLEQLSPINQPDGYHSQISLPPQIHLLALDEVSPRTKSKNENKVCQDMTILTPSKDNMKNNNAKVCYMCHSEGHLMSECPVILGLNQGKRYRRKKTVKERVRPKFFEKLPKLPTDSNWPSDHPRGYKLWMFTSAFVYHTTNNIKEFTSFKKASGNLSVDDKIFSIEGIGIVPVVIIDPINRRQLTWTMKNVLYVPSLDFSIFTLEDLIKRGISYYMNHKGVHSDFNGDFCLATYDKKARHQLLTLQKN